MTLSHDVHKQLDSSFAELTTAFNAYRVKAVVHCSSQQLMFLSEVERRIRQSNSLIRRLVQYVDSSPDRAIWTISTLVQCGEQTGQRAFDLSQEVSDEVWLLTEAFYWNAFRTLDVIWGKGIKIKNGSSGLPGIGITAKRTLGVCRVRNQLIEHPECIGGSFSQGPSRCGPSIGSWREPDQAEKEIDQGLYANAVEWAEYVARRLNVGISFWGDKTPTS